MDVNTSGPSSSTRVAAHVYVYVPEEASEVVSVLVLTRLLTPLSVIEVVPSLAITVVVLVPSILLLHWKRLVTALPFCVVAVQSIEKVLYGGTSKTVSGAGDKETVSVGAVRKKYIYINLRNVTAVSSPTLNCECQ